MTPEQIAEQQEAIGGKRKHGRWSLTNMLLATIADRVAVSNYYTEAINSEKGKGPKRPPDPIPRPGVEPRSASIESINPDALAAIQKMRANRGAKDPGDWREVDRGAA